MAELSAGHHLWSDAVQTYTVRNLALRLFHGRPDVSGRLIRLGCFFSEAARAGFVRYQFSGTGLPPTDDRTPVTAKADRGAYEAIVNLANFCTTFGLDVACTRAVVAQAVHVAERGNHHLVHSTLTAVKNDWQKHAVSATHGGKKTTLVTYAGYTRRFCAWGDETASTGGGLMPLNRHVVVSWLEVEARRRLVRKAPWRRGRGGATAGARARGAAVADAEGSESSSGDSADDLPDAGDTDLDAGPARKRPRAAVFDVFAGVTATGRYGVASTARRGRGGAAAGRGRGSNATAGRGSRGAAEAGQGGCGGEAAGRGQRGGCATGRGGQGGDAVGPGPRGRAAAGRGGRGGHGGTAPQSANGGTPPYAYPASNPASPARVAAGAREGRWTGRRPMERLRAAGVHRRAPRLF
ncbi:hypothetical protein BU14_0150s0036 [Porphyra umbilicalis]|uniref:Uncharacterized protein n=1 Tax=Porphyra umbilicalis TaxID=2786 RepID=A0A1X6P998_PORUM|nr:hypothetical protein BU14_0150s0036 [Porphyra umbilicalis]|eukprot:OSX77424.1 hypothetical protein BU14_0150s0036 [Porphyra umbilicalis]